MVKRFSSRKFKKIKRNSNKKNIRKNNPSIFSFHISSSFIFEPRFSSQDFSKLLDKNLIKPDNNEIDVLKKNIIDKSEYKDSNKIIFISQNIKDILLNVKKILPKKDDKAILIENIINSNSTSGHISVRRITTEYNKICMNIGLKKISKSTVYRIIKKKLLLSYRKTNIKNSKLVNQIFIKYGYFFLKILLRSLSLGINPIFLDETGFYPDNKNFFTWRKQGQIIYHRLENKKKINLLMAVSNKKIYHYMITNENTNNKIFKTFIKELIDKMGDEEKQNNIIILDNLSCHLTSDLFDLYNKEKLKILFNIPYQSQWNMIELVFRLLKNIIYKKLYNNTKELKNDIIEIIESGKIEDSLPLLYNETIYHYLNFLNKYNNYNLND